MTDLARTRESERLQLLGMPFDRVTVADVVDRMEGFIRDPRPRRIACVNVALYVWARSSSTLWDFYLASDLLVADGMGIYYASRLLGDPTPGITNAVFIMYDLLARAEQRGYRVYFLGTTDPILERAIRRFQELHPRLHVVGRRNGFFTVSDEADLVREIRATKPDILLIGISSLRKEEFLGRNLECLGVPVCFGVGGAFDVAAGAHRFAPQWVRIIGLEWVYRLAQEPSRLWKRYLTTNAIFGWLLLAEMVRRLVRSIGGTSS